MNKLIIIGNVVADSELNYTSEGLAYLKFRVADNSYHKNADGTRSEETTYHNVALFGERAETYGELLHKGVKVYVEGRLKIKEYTPKGTQDKQRYHEVVNATIELLSPKSSVPTQQME